MDIYPDPIKTTSLYSNTKHSAWKQNRVNNNPKAYDRFIREVNPEAYHLDTKKLFNHKNPNYEYNCRLYNALYGESKKIDPHNSNIINNNFDVPNRVFKKPNGSIPFQPNQKSKTYPEIDCVKILDAPGATHDYYSSQMTKVGGQKIALNLQDRTYMYDFEKNEIGSTFETGQVKRIESNRPNQFVTANDQIEYDENSMYNRFSNEFSIWDVESVSRAHQFAFDSNAITTFGLADSNSPLHNNIILAGKRRELYIYSPMDRDLNSINLNNVDERIHSQAVRVYGSGNNIYIGTNTGIDVRDIRNTVDSIFSMYTNGAIRAIDNDSKNLYFGGGSSYPKASKVELNSGSVTKNYDVGTQVTNIVTTNKFLYLSKGYPFHTEREIDILNKKTFQRVSQSSNFSQSRCKDLVMLKGDDSQPDKLVALFEPNYETIKIYEPLEENSIQKRNHYTVDPMMGLSNRFSNMSIIR